MAHLPRARPQSLFVHLQHHVLHSLNTLHFTLLSSRHTSFASSVLTLPSILGLARFSLRGAWGSYQAHGDSTNHAPRSSCSTFCGANWVRGSSISNITSTYNPRDIAYHHPLALHYTCMRLKDLDVGVCGARGSSIACHLERNRTLQRESFDEISDSWLALISYIFSYKTRLSWLSTASVLEEPSCRVF
jgi:hypothetical protein